MRINENFGEAEAWERLEDVIAESIEGLPDFPGFEQRAIFRLNCSEGDDEGPVVYELHYTFSIEASHSPLVREQYPELLKQRWEELGYDLHRDDTNENNGWRDIEARRSDEVNAWFAMWDGVRLVAQSGCLERQEDVEHPCPRPLGGVLEENDPAMLKLCPDGYAEDTGPADAMAPFGDGQAALAPFSPETTRRRGPPDACDDPI